MAGRTRAIVRLDGWNRMVTKGYQKGVYERVTKGISGKMTGRTYEFRRDSGKAALQGRVTRPTAIGASAPVGHSVL